MTSQSLEQVKARVIDLWIRRGVKEKLTREAKADLLGVSVATSERILAGKGVDRTTLILAFAKLGLPWEDACCEPCQVIEPGPPREDNLDGVSPTKSAAQPKPHALARVRLRRASIAIAVVTALAFAVILTLKAATPPERYWGDVFHAHLTKGSEAFHAGDLRTARTHIDAANDLARSRNGGKELGSSLRIAGDIAAAEGAYTEAINLYEEALNIRTAFEDDRGVPAILEAIGDLETRAGYLDQAEGHLLKSLALFRTYNDPTGMAMASRNLGSLAFKRGQLAKASKWFDDALASIKGLQKPDIEMDLKGRRALILRDQGKVAEARTQLQGCLSYWTQREHPRWIATTLHQLSTVEAKAGNRGLAIQLAMASKSRFEGVGDALGSEDLKKWLDSLTGVVGTRAARAPSAGIRTLVPASRQGSTANAR